MGRERRKYPRAEIHLTIRYRIGPVEESKFQIVYSRNISRGGVLFTTVKKMQIGVAIKIEIDLPMKNRVPVTGRVVRCQEVENSGKIRLYNVALEFQDFNIYRETFDHIDDIVKRKIYS